VRTAAGALDPALVDEAEERARALYARVFPGTAADPALAVQPAGGWVALAAGLERALASEAGFGRSAAESRAARRSAEELVRAFGPEAAWSRLTPAALAAGWRTLARRDPATRRGGPGAADAALGVLFTAARWLEAEGLIPPGAALPPPRWRARFRAGPGGDRVPDTDPPGPGGGDRP
jgi:hypothetical protein